MENKIIKWEMLTKEQKLQIINGLKWNKELPKQLHKIVKMAITLAQYVPAFNLMGLNRFKIEILYNTYKKRNFDLLEV